jgi:hypothetical protein
VSPLTDTVSSRPFTRNASCSIILSFPAEIDKPKYPTTCGSPTIAKIMFIDASGASTLRVRHPLLSGSWTNCDSPV